MPQASDSNYIALTRHRRPFSTAGRPPVLEIVDDAWATEAILPDDDLMITRYEQAVSSNLLLFAEDEIDGGDHTSVPVVTPIIAQGGGNGGSGSGGMGGSGNTGNPMLDRRRREEMWNDLGLDQLISAVDLAHFSSTSGTTTNAAAAAAGTSTQRHSNQNQNQSQTQTPTR